MADTQTTEDQRQPGLALLLRKVFLFLKVHLDSDLGLASEIE